MLLKVSEWGNVNGKAYLSGFYCETVHMQAGHNLCGYIGVQARGIVSHHQLILPLTSMSSEPRPYNLISDLYRTFRFSNSL